MAISPKYANGLRFGLITAALYMLLLFIRYHFFYTSPAAFSVFSIVSYLIILVMFLLACIARRKELGGYAELREIFQSVFIVILITEAVYVFFNFLYLKYIDPGFYARFEAGYLAYFRHENLSTEQEQQEVKNIRSFLETTKPSYLWKGFAPAVVADSLICFVFAFVLRRKKPIAPETNSLT